MKAFSKCSIKLSFKVLLHLVLVVGEGTSQKGTNKKYIDP